jgi:mono/diheme cytochrome c family protein
MFDGSACHETLVLFSDPSDAFDFVQRNSRTEIGDTQNGLAWAQQVCSECHAIRRGQARSPNTRSPTFSELATTPGMTVGALMVALTTPHAGMPMFLLTATQREDIIAYILSLR